MLRSDSEVRKHIQECVKPFRNTKKNKKNQRVSSKTLQKRLVKPKKTKKPKTIQANYQKTIGNNQKNQKNQKHVGTPAARNQKNQRNLRQSKQTTKKP